MIAEKFQAMVVLGMANSRMKDYYDVWMLTGAFEVDPERMRRAIAATFARRTLSGTTPEFRRMVSELRDRLASYLALK